MKKRNWALRPDAQGFDEVRLITVPRYKTSDMSGDEWRISIKAQYFRNGEMKFEELVSSDMQYACAFMGYKYTIACEGMHQYFAGEDDWCDQEGCSNKATVVYKQKFDYCRDGHKSERESERFRKFCDNHKTRGDCGLNDADINYELVP